jgi:hypothetical protein
MLTSDYIGFTLTFGWGIWWTFFPQSVISFYRAIRLAASPDIKPWQVRIGGTVWLVLALFVLISYLRK